MKTITNQEHDWIASAIGEGLTSLVAYHSGHPDSGTVPLALINAEKL